VSERVRLGEIIDVASGQVDPRTTPYCDLPHVGGDNIESGSGRIFGLRTARELNLISGKYEFGPTDVLYSKIRPALNKVALPSFKGICSADMYPLRPHNERIERRYLAYLLRHDDFLSYTEKHSTRTNIPKINREALLAYELTLPSIHEQLRIADNIDKADAIRRKRKEAIALTEELLRSVFLEMFGDPVTNPKAWPVKSLGELLSEIQGGWSPVCLARTATDDEWGVLKLGAVTFGRYEESENKALGSEHTPVPELEVKAGDVLFSRKNTYEHVAACVLVTRTRGRLIIPDLIFRLMLHRDSRMSPAVLWAMLSHGTKRQQIQSLAGGTAGSMPNISKERLRSVVLPVPPHELQERFEINLNAIEHLRTRYVAAALQGETLFESLMSRAFSGHIGGNPRIC
jgi:type I restriction enzyme S subunit